MAKTKSINATSKLNKKGKYLSNLFTEINSIVKSKNFLFSLIISIIVFIPLFIRINSNNLNSLWLNFFFSVVYFLFFLILIYLAIEDIHTLSIRAIIAYFGLIFSLTINLLTLIFFAQNIEIYSNSFFIPINNIIAGGLLGFIIWLIVKITKEQGMGEGDIYVYAMSGLFLGTERLIPAFYITILSALIVGIVVSIIRKKFKGLLIPFIPFIAFGTVISIIFTPEVINLARLFFPFLY